MGATVPTVSRGAEECAIWGALRMIRGGERLGALHEIDNAACDAASGWQGVEYGLRLQVRELTAIR